MRSGALPRPRLSQGRISSNRRALVRRPGPSQGSSLDPSVASSPYPVCDSSRNPSQGSGRRRCSQRGSSHPSSADGRWLGRSLRRSISSPPLPLGTRLFGLRCRAGLLLPTTEGPPPPAPARKPPDPSRLPASSGVERSDRPRSLKPSLSLFLPLPRSSGGSLLGERRGETPKNFYVDLRSDGATR